MNKICYGCGAKLQASDKEGVGYIPEKKIKDAAYCMRCFRMIHYGEQKSAEVPKDAKEIINKINKDVRFVIFLVDFLNLNSEVVKMFKSIKKEKLLVVNKCELMPRHIKKERVAEFIREYYEINDPIKLKGGTTSHGAKSILNYLEKENIKEAYILGMSNSGKSTLINDLVDICDSRIAKITVNKRANTTLDFIRVKLHDDLTLIDSPGFVLEKSLNSDTTGKNITAFNINMKECETASLLDNQYFVKFDANTPIVFYTNAVAKKAIRKYHRAAEGLVNTIKITESNMDIIIYGIGFITVKKPVTITTNIDLRHIEVRSSMFGENHE